MIKVVNRHGNTNIYCESSPDELSKLTKHLRLSSAGRDFAHSLASSIFRRESRSRAQTHLSRTIFAFDCPKAGPDDAEHFSLGCTSDGKLGSQDVPTTAFLHSSTSPNQGCCTKGSSQNQQVPAFPGTLVADPLLVEDVTFSGNNASLTAFDKGLRPNGQFSGGVGRPSLKPLPLLALQPMSQQTDLVSVVGPVLVKAYSARGCGTSADRQSPVKNRSGHRQPLGAYPGNSRVCSSLDPEIHRTQGPGARRPRDRRTGTVCAQPPEARGSFRLGKLLAALLYSAELA